MEVLDLVGWLYWSLTPFSQLMSYHGGPVGDTHVFPSFLTPVLTQLFLSHRLIFSHASAEVRGENTPERKFASTGVRTHNHQVMSPTRSPLSHPGGAFRSRIMK